MSSDSWLNPNLRYVGANKNALGLANPWSSTMHSQARFYVTNKAEALYKYREWLFKKILPSLNYPGGTAFLDTWEKVYLSQVLSLAGQIKSKEITALGCWCIQLWNYDPFPDGGERCHAEILYKACLQIINRGDS